MVAVQDERQNEDWLRIIARKRHLPVVVSCRRRLSELPVIVGEHYFSAKDTVLASVVKIGKEGYIHGYICVRPPCGQYTEAHFDSKTGSVLHDGTRIGKLRKNEDGTFSVTHHAADGTKEKLGARYGKRGGAAMMVVPYHNLAVLHEQAAPGEVKDELGKARVALKAGSHGVAVMHLARAEVAASKSGDAVTSSHVLDVKAALIPGLQPEKDKLAEAMEVQVLPEKPAPISAPKRVSQAAIQTARDALTHANIWYHPHDDAGTKLTLARNALDSGDAAGAVTHLRAAHELAVASGQDGLAGDIEKAHDAVAPELGLAKLNEKVPGNLEHDAYLKAGAEQYSGYAAFGTKVNLDTAKKVFEDAVNTAPPQAPELYRGLAGGTKGEDPRIDALHALKPGDTFTEPGIASWTSSKEYGEGFAGDGIYPRSIVLHLPSGSPALNIERYSQVPDEKEWVRPATTYRLTSKHEENGLTYLDVEPVTAPTRVPGSKVTKP